MSESVEEMFRRLARCAAGRLASGDPQPTSAAYWLAVYDQSGFDCSRVDRVTALHALAEKQGVVACASVTHFRHATGAEALLAYVVGREPEDSDLRQAAIRRQTGADPSLDEWSRIL